MPTQTNSTSERKQRQANLTEQDKTRFLERGFAVVENAGHSLRLIKRDDARQAISIKWDDLPALRELITLALDDGPMVIGVDTSGQAAKNAAISMRDLCVEKVRTRRDRFQQAADSSSLPNDLTASRDAAVAAAFTRLMGELQSLTLEQEQK